MQLVLENYRCFRSTELRLSPLTVVLGPNASGKTSLLRALNPGVPLTPRDVWQRRDPKLVRVHLKGPNVDWENYLSAKEGFHQRGSRQPAYQMLQLDAAHLRAAGGLERVGRLSISGHNLINLFDSLTREQQGELSREFCALVPVFGDVDREPLGSSQQLRFRDAFNQQAVWYSPVEVSDGSMFVLAFLILQFQQPPVEILAIEEPERGLHPYLVDRVITILRDMAEGNIGGRKMHVVITTHSPSTLEFVRRDEIRLLNRASDGSVSIDEPPVDDDRWRDAFEVYGRSMGAMWLSGGLGGVPGS